MRMKEGSYRPLKDQHNKHKRWYKHTIHYCYMYILYRLCICMGVMTVLEGYRDGRIVESVGVNVLYAFTALIYFYSHKISYIKISISFSFEHHDYNVTNIYTGNVQCLVLRTDQHTKQCITNLQRQLMSAVAVSTKDKGVFNILVVCFME